MARITKIKTVRRPVSKGANNVQPKKRRVKKTRLQQKRV